MTERKKDDVIERRALALYDRLNPDWERTIRVSKAECIKMAQREIAARRARAYGEEPSR